MTSSKEDILRTGLTDEQVRKSRAAHGENVLTPPQRPSWWRLYIEKFNDPVVRILLVAALLSLAISVVENEYAETVGILVAVLLATGIGFFFEYDAGKKFDILNAVNEETLVKVVRNGHVCQVTRREIVVGDIVLLEAGDEVPADGRLIEAVSMQVNESNLTGEPVTMKSVVEAHFDKEATYASNWVMRGTVVVDGHGTMCVGCVGDATEIGKVACQSTEQSGEPTPLDSQLSKLATLIGRVGFSVAGIAFAVFFIKDVVCFYDFSSFHTFLDWMPALQATLRYFMMAVTLIVVAVPEGLPMSVTLSLALNMRRMLSTNNLVRKMHACETMGAITVICTDKTGTLTQNRMQVYEADFYAMGTTPDWQGHWGRVVAEGISANSTAFLEEDVADGGLKGVGNPTEVALLLWLHGQGCHYLPLREATELVEQQTFSTERKYMATQVVSSWMGKKVIYVKGAPEVVLARCRDVVLADGRRVELSQYASCVEERLRKYQQMAMRTLGFAYRITDDPLQEATDGWTFLGVVAISDPVRPDVPAAVERCRRAGIEVKIVTGDTSGTAVEIARQIGLWTPDDDDRNYMAGADFAALTDEEALERLPGLKVMSRARPADKQRLVQLLQRQGAVVAVTGDGTNDAPALNHAQVGLSMGTGTSVAKEASDITLLDDSFQSIGTAVMWGRSLYKNIQRFILFQLTINFVALFVVLAGALVGTELPLTVTQMLWVNLIMDTFAALALASVPPSESVMQEPPRRSSDFIITVGMRRMIIGMGLCFSFFLMGMLMVFETLEGGMTVHRLTVFFTVFVMLQFWNLLNVRVFGTTDSAFRGLGRSYGMLTVLAIILCGQYLIVQFGGEVFRTEPLDALTWVTVIVSTSLVLWIGEAVRLVRRWRTCNDLKQKK